MCQPSHFLDAFLLDINNIRGIINTLREIGKSKTMHNSKDKNLFVLSEKLQNDVNGILTDFKEYIRERDEDEQGKIHFDVDFVLEKMENIHFRKERSLKKQHVQKAQSSHDESPRVYTSEFYSGPLPDRSRRPFGKLNQAARFIFRSN